MSLKSRLTEISQYSFNFSECADKDLPSFLGELHSNICPELDSEAKIIASMALQWRFVTQLLRYAVKKSFTNDQTIGFINQQIDQIWEIYWEEAKKYQIDYDKRKDAFRQKQIEETLNKEFGIESTSDSETLLELTKTIADAAEKIQKLIGEQK